MIVWMVVWRATGEARSYVKSTLLKNPLGGGMLRSLARNLVRYSAASLAVAALAPLLAVTLAPHALAQSGADSASETDAEAQPEATTAAGADVSSPALTLARRLLGPWGDAGGGLVEITPQELPQDLPNELPLPEELSVVGSLANYGPEGDLLHAQVVLNSPHSPNETQRILETAFSNAGWTATPQGAPTGFMPLNAHVAALYCGPENLSFIHMNAFGAGGITDVRLEVNTETMYSPCDDGAFFAEETPHIPLPTLNAPEGSQITLHGGNYLEEQASSSAVLRTDLPGDELLRHFEAQLEQAGWSRADVEDPGQSVWTRTHEGRDWRGVLSITNLGAPDPQYYAAFVVVETTN
ncbi:MAG: hypothetical protein WD273_01145 [Trueperaceae bacterium]